MIFTLLPVVFSKVGFIAVGVTVELESMSKNMFDLVRHIFRLIKVKIIHPSYCKCFCRLMIGLFNSTFE